MPQSTRWLRLERDGKAQKKREGETILYGRLPRCVLRMPPVAVTFDSIIPPSMSVWPKFNIRLEPGRNSPQRTTATATEKRVGSQRTNRQWQNARKCCGKMRRRGNHLVVDAATTTSYRNAAAIFQILRLGKKECRELVSFDIGTTQRTKKKCRISSLGEKHKFLFFSVFETPRGIERRRRRRRLLFASSSTCLVGVARFFLSATPLAMTGIHPTGQYTTAR